MSSAADGPGTGVYGESGSGAGVSGRSGTGPGVLGESTTVGVEGRSEKALSGIGGEGIGVAGFSSLFIGVHGESGSDRGGVFESHGTAAQLRLIPHAQKTETPELPKSGKVGDIVLIRNTGSFGTDRQVDRCSLWLCVPQIPGKDASSQWQEIQLGLKVTGTA